MARIAVVGAGMRGSAVCAPLAERGHDVRRIGTPLDAARRLGPGRARAARQLAALRCADLPLPPRQRVPREVELGLARVELLLA